VGKPRGKHRDDSAPEGISRRKVLGIGAAAAGAAAAGSVIRPRARAAAAGPGYPLAPNGTTLQRTLLHGPPVNSKGYRHIVVGPGEPSLLRADLLGGATRNPAATRTPLLALNQLTDMHILDAQSPARVEFLDRLSDPGTPQIPGAPSLSAAYRPNEMLTAQVAESMVRALNQVSAAAPVSGRPVDFAMCTGDNVDNTQYNELRWQIDVLDGHKSVRPDSGDFTKWQGVGGPDDKDPHYWHPNGTPPFGTVDQARGTYGYPVVSGLLNQCRKPFTSTGLHTPWYTAFGNHDGLVQGNAPALGVLNAIAVGNYKVFGAPTGIDETALVEAFLAGDPAALQALLAAGPVKFVHADHDRRLLTLRQTVEEHFNTTGTPVGHGYTQANVTAGTAYYTFDPTPEVHCIVLDTCNPDGYSEGSIDRNQFNWLKNELLTHSSSYLNSNGGLVSNSGTDKLIVVFSHHTIATMTNPIGIDRVLGPEVQTLLLQFPNVVLWVNGHTHRNTITAHSRSGTAAVGGGFWEINTASHIDWPQQARVVELVDNGDATLSIFGTIVDHVAPPAWSLLTLGNPVGLASLARELAVNDWQRDAETATEDGKRGAISDRNVELVVRRPF
jgi:metallophosphoesterase (TIGR03767 family)